MEHSDISASSRAKDRHIEVSLAQPVESVYSNGFDAFELVSDLPDFALDQLETKTRLLGRTLSIPLFISSMTGGTSRAGEINARLAVAAERLGIGLAVGSQHLMLRDPSLKATFSVRHLAPDILLFADLGLVHLNHDLTPVLCRQAVETIEADALMLYINPLHEAVQAEGSTDFTGLLDKLAALCADFPYPVLVKEVGFGLSPSTLERLSRLPLAGVDVAGRGGTHWGRVEAALGGRPLDSALEQLGWATAYSLEAAVEILPQTMLVFASGGIRNGVEVAKALALGADAVGMGLPFLRWACESTERIVAEVSQIERELRVAMWYAGAQEPATLAGRARRRPDRGE